MMRTLWKKGSAIAWFISELTDQAGSADIVVMPRKMRVEYPDAVYHIMSRRDRSEDIFLDDVDHQDFLKNQAQDMNATENEPCYG